MTDWLEVWERKGRSETTDLRTLDGFERPTIDPEAVARDAVFIGDPPERRPSPDHRLYEKARFAGWRVTPGFYNPDRFNAFLRIAPPAPLAGA